MFSPIFSVPGRTAAAHGESLGRQRGDADLYPGHARRGRDPGETNDNRHDDNDISVARSVVSLYIEFMIVLYIEWSLNLISTCLINLFYMSILDPIETKAVRAHSGSHLHLLSQFMLVL